MKGRKHISWIASALLTLVVALVLIGCPHNGMLSVDSGDNSTSGGRTGNNGLSLVITNFVPKTPAGPARTISPDSINLTNQGERDKYIFLASGYNDSGDNLPPTKVDVGTQGEVSLPIASGGTWTITIDAYDRTLLGQEGVQDLDNVDKNKAEQINGKKADCAVLTGTAVVVGTGTTVSLTLTNDGVGTEGNANVAVYFDTQSDKDKIDDKDNNGNKKLKVKVALYNLETGKMITKVGGGNTEQDIHDGTTNVASPVRYDVSDIPKGHYQFRLTVYDPADQDKAKASWSDDIFIEGNRTNGDDVRITNLFKTPTQPTGFKAYWTPPQTGELKEGFLAYFAWTGLDTSATGVDIEIADITNWYTLQNGQTDQVTFNGGAGQALNTHTDLWDEIKDLPKKADGGQAPFYEDVVTTLTWDNNPQEAINYPAIWRDGSLLNGGGDKVTFLMRTGRVYSARIRARGATDESEWLILGDDPAQGTYAAPTEPQALPKVPNYTAQGDNKPTKFNQPRDGAGNGLFDLVKITYKLNDNFLLYKNTGAGIGTQATATDLQEYSEYQGAQKIELKLKYQGQNMTNNPTNGDWVLYPKLTLQGNAPAQLDDRIKTWTGWCDETDTNTKFGPTEPQQDPWKYSGYKDLTLIPLGASGTLVLKAKTSGTYNVLSEDNVLVDIDRTGQATVAQLGFGELKNGADANLQQVKTTTLGLAKDDAKNRYLLNMDNANRNNAANGNGQKTFLYVSVGKTATQDDLGTLLDADDDEFTVEDITVTLTKAGTVAKRFTKATGSDYIAYAQLDGLRGDFVVRVEILTNTGYRVSYQTDFAIKYDDQVVP